MSTQDSISKIHTNQVYCPLAWYSLTGQKEGTIGVCCIHDYKNEEEKLGSIQESGFTGVWNTPKLKKLRKNMLSGQKSSYCENCYKKESLGLTSLRQKALTYYGKFTQEFIADTNFDGEYSGPIKKIDLRLSNLCNLACRMCSGDSSTSRYELDKKLGIYYTGSYTQEPYDTHNFWDDIKNWNTVEKLKFAGGEPLLNPNLYKLLEKLISCGYAQNISLTFLTNLTILPGINGYKSFLFGDYKNIFEIVNEFHSCSFHISIDGYKKSYDYIRIGSSWENLEKNIYFVLDEVKKHKDISIEFMPTIQKDNVYDFPKLYLFAKKRNIKIDVKPLIRPEYLSIAHLPLGEKHKVNIYYQSCIEKYQKFSPEIKKDFEYILKYMNNTQSDEKYIDEYKEKTKIIDTFMREKQIRNNLD